MMPGVATRHPAPRSSAPRVGRPTGWERQRLLAAFEQVMAQGHDVEGWCPVHVLARHAGVPLVRAQVTLWNLRREGLVGSEPLPRVAPATQSGPPPRGRPPVVYRLCTRRYVVPLAGGLLAAQAVLGSFFQSRFQESATQSP